MIEWFIIPIAYLVGSVSSAIVVCKVMGLPDPRGQGSGNPGATNVMRFGGKKAAIITLVSDLLKGLIMVVLAKLLTTDTIAVVTAMAVFLGNLFPIFYQLKGGKGVATGCGVMFGLYWLLGLAVVLTWVAVFKKTNISSLSAIVAALLMPVYAWLLIDQTQYIVVTCIISILSLWRHRSNIFRLIKGEED
jgi:glycerol-3-phosphate acyltransferase PlsY